MNIVHLMASPFVGGPERQVLGLARALAANHRTTFLSFAERGFARPFLERARADGFDAIELKENFPRLRRAIDEVADHLRRLRADVLCCSGYKPDLIGWRSARRAGVPVLGVAHGWTGVTLKVRLYETADAVALRFMDAAVPVSEAMAHRLRKAGVPARKINVIRNALDATPYDKADPQCRQRVEAFFPESVSGNPSPQPPNHPSPHLPARSGMGEPDCLPPPLRFGEGVGGRGVFSALGPPRLIVGGAGRLSPEKGFDVLLEAAALVCRQRADVGFVIFGDGPMRPALQQRIAALALQHRFVLAGFRTDLERLLPGLDLAVLSSHTEGLPVAVLEAQAAGVPVVATAVGGTPEVVLDGVTGWLTPPANPLALAEMITHALENDEQRRARGSAGRQRVRDEFTFATQAMQYQRLFERLISHRHERGAEQTTGERENRCHAHA